MLSLNSSPSISPTVAFYVVRRFEQDLIAQKSCRKQIKTPKILRFTVFLWWRLLDSNQWPPACEWDQSFHDRSQNVKTIALQEIERFSFVRVRCDYQGVFSCLSVRLWYGRSIQKSNQQHLSCNSDSRSKQDENSPLTSFLQLCDCRRPPQYHLQLSPHAQPLTGCAFSFYLFKPVPL